MKRIYKLAEELRFTPQRIIELLPFAGVHGKRSPLTQLSGEEIQKLKDLIFSKPVTQTDQENHDE